MTVGKLISLLCKQASDEDVYLMGKGISSIEAYDDGIHLYFTDSSAEDYFIKGGSEW